MLANYLLEFSPDYMRQKVAEEVVNIYKSVWPRMYAEQVCQNLNEKSRVVQMNFVAIACDNLGIPTPIGNNVWTRISNPNLIEHEAISRI